MSTETITPELLAGIAEERRIREQYAEGAAARRDSAELDRRDYAARAEQLAIVHSYLETRLGRTLEDVGREVEAEVRQLEAAYDAAHERADAAREELRDLEGYRRVLQRLADEATPSEGQEQQ